jgi:hypothetical protein
MSNPPARGSGPPFDPNETLERFKNLTGGRFRLQMSDPGGAWRGKRQLRWWASPQGDNVTVDLQWESVGSSAWALALAPRRPGGSLTPTRHPELGEDRASPSVPRRYERPSRGPCSPLSGDGRSWGRRRQRCLRSQRPSAATICCARSRASNGGRVCAGSSGGGTRTHNLGLNRPLLCRLSYPGSRRRPRRLASLPRGLGRSPRPAGRSYSR